MIENELVDYLRIDMVHAGGITEAKKILAAGESHGQRSALHHASSPVNGTACLHVDLAVPNFGIQEWMELEPLYELFPERAPRAGRLRDAACRSRPRPGARRGGGAQASLTGRPTAAALLAGRQRRRLLDERAAARRLARDLRRLAHALAPVRGRLEALGPPSRRHAELRLQPRGRSGADAVGAASGDCAATTCRASPRPSSRTRSACSRASAPATAASCSRATARSLPTAATWSRAAAAAIARRSGDRLAGALASRHVRARGHRGSRARAGRAGDRQEHLERVQLDRDRMAAAEHGRRDARARRDGDRHVRRDDGARCRRPRFQRDPRRGRDGNVLRASPSGGAERASPACSVRSGTPSTCSRPCSCGATPRARPRRPRSSARDSRARRGTAAPGRAPCRRSPRATGSPSSCWSRRARAPGSLRSAAAAPPGAPSRARSGSRRGARRRDARSRPASRRPGRPRVPG